MHINGFGLLFSYCCLPRHIYSKINSLFGLSNQFLLQDISPSVLFNPLPLVNPCLHCFHPRSALNKQSHEKNALASVSKALIQKMQLNYSQQLSSNNDSRSSQFVQGSLHQKHRSPGQGANLRPFQRHQRQRRQFQWLPSGGRNSSGWPSHYDRQTLLMLRPLSLFSVFTFRFCKFFSGFMSTSKHTIISKVEEIPPDGPPIMIDKHSWCSDPCLFFQSLHFDFASFFLVLCQQANIQLSLSFCRDHPLFFWLYFYYIFNRLVPELTNKKL